MGSTSISSLSSYPKLSLRLHSSLDGSVSVCRAPGALVSGTVSFTSRRRRYCSRKLVVMAASPAGGRRRVYRETQSENPLTIAPVKQIASFVVPAAAFCAATFGMESPVYCFLILFHIFRLFWS